MKTTLGLRSPAEACCPAATALRAARSAARRVSGLRKVMAGASLRRSVSMTPVRASGFGDLHGLPAGHEDPLVNRRQGKELDPQGDQADEGVRSEPQAVEAMLGPDQRLEVRQRGQGEREEVHRRMERNGRDE